MNIQPLQNFVLIQFRPKNDSKIVLPGGSKNPEADVFVLAVGPEVPKEMGLEKGTQISLRGDAKIFGFEMEKSGAQDGSVIPFETACIQHQAIMAIIRPDEPVLNAEDLNAAIEAVNSGN